MSGFVYVVASSNGMFKIGHTTHPRRRLTMLRTSTADTLTLLGVVPATLDQEREIHHCLRRYRVAREWFRPSPAMKPLIDALRPMPTPVKVRRAVAEGGKEEWRQRLAKAIEADGRSRRQLSLDAGLGINFVSQLITTHRSATADSLSRIGAALGVPVSAFFGSAA